MCTWRGFRNIQTALMTPLNMTGHSAHQIWMVFSSSVATNIFEIECSWNDFLKPHTDKHIFLIFTKSKNNNNNNNSKCIIWPRGTTEAGAVVPLVAVSVVHTYHIADRKLRSLCYDVSIDGHHGTAIIVNTVTIAALLVGVEVDPSALSYQHPQTQRSSKVITNST